ncbi:EAL domain-containing protein [Lacticaseibacillus kribbianus]|uniref:EAL domain-containing protein n=1 Tax=Lacticaseibacillus kribbianus TaxID=2926292 RepID=UPI001CD7BFC9|nr:EAL domain-containing protein [Lacticaseibacillus kribbianus]
MLRYFGQPKFSNATPPVKIGYELLLREFTRGRWQLPGDFSAYAPDDLSRLLAQTLAAMPASLDLISFNLSQRQFIDPAFSQALRRVQAFRRMNLFAELTEADEGVTLAALQAAAGDYVAAGIRVVIDDVGTGANRESLVQALMPYTSEYKFALQNLAGDRTRPVLAMLGEWRDRATADHKLFAVEGLENASDLALVAPFAPDVLQGYHFGRPQLMAIG